MIGKAIMLGSVFVTHDDQTSNWTDISRHRPAPECPLWVISGHVRLHEKASAFRLKTDTPRDAERASFHNCGVGSLSRAQAGLPPRARFQERKSLMSVKQETQEPQLLLGQFLFGKQ